MKNFFTNIKSIFLRYKILFLLLLTPISLFLIITARLSSGFAEWYSRHILRYTAYIFNNITGIFPFSLIELLIILLIPASIIYIIISIIKIKKSKNPKTTVGLVISIPLCFLSTMLFLFVTNYGISYYRYTFAQVYGLEVRNSTSDELTELCIYLAENANSTRKLLPTENGEMALSISLDDTIKEAKKSYDNISEQYFTLYSGYSTCKKVIFSEVMSHTNTLGVFSPFTFEANINVNINPSTIPFTICHELSHLRGYAREDEANFIAYIVCKNSDSIDFQYSAYIYSLRMSLNKLYSADKEKYNYVYSILSDDVKNDLIAYNSYWSQYKNTVSQISHKVNNIYLQINSQKDGEQSYGRMVDLLLAEYRSNKK